MRSLAFACVFLTSSGLKCPLGPRKGGITRETCVSERRSLMRKPLSAMISSPSSSKDRIPHSLISLSGMEPVYRSLTNVTSPDGENVRPIRALKVVLPL